MAELLIFCIVFSIIIDHPKLNALAIWALFGVNLTHAPSNFLTLESLGYLIFASYWSYLCLQKITVHTPFQNLRRNLFLSSLALAAFLSNNNVFLITLCILMLLLCFDQQVWQRLSIFWVLKSSLFLFCYDSGPMLNMKKLATGDGLASMFFLLWVYSMRKDLEKNQQEYIYYWG